MSTWAELGTSFGHDAAEYNTQAILDARLDELWAAGMRKLRVNIPHFSTDASNPVFRDKLRNVCTTAMARGFYVVWGYTANTGANLTSTTWLTYSTAIQSMATWAETLPYTNKFELCVGNEEDPRVDGSTLTSAQLRDNLKALATACKALFTKGRTSVACTTGYYADWKALGLGDIDFLGLNLYGSEAIFDSFITRLKTDFGPRGYLSEWNAHDDGTVNFTTDAKYTREIARRYRVIIDLQVPAYLFGFTQSSGVPQKWAFKLTDESYRNAWFVLKNRRSLLAAQRKSAATIEAPYSYFNGVNATYDCGDLPATEGVPALSIFYRTRPRNGAFYSQFRKRTSISDWSYQLEFSMPSNTITYGVNADTNTNKVYSLPASLSLDDWTSVGLVYDGTTVTLFINGVAVGSYAKTGNVAGSTAKLWLGSNTGASGYYAGSLRDVRIYSRALSSAEMTQLANNQEPSATSLQAWWKLAERSGQSAADSSGNGNTAAGVAIEHRFDYTLGVRSAVANRFLLPTVDEMSLSLTAGSDGMTVPIVPNIAGFSFGFWHRPGAPAMGERMLLNWESAADRNGFNFRMNSGGQLALVTSNAGAVTTVATSTVRLKRGVWVHIAMTLASGVVRIYLNGVQVATTTGVSMTSNVNPVALGRRSYAATGGAPGNFKDFVFRNTTTAWTVAQITDLYYRRKAPAGSTLFCKLDNDVTDSSGSGNNGTLIGGGFAATRPLSARRTVA